MVKQGSGPLSYSATLVLQALAQGQRYGFDIMRLTELASGTVYPLLRRLEAAGLVHSNWEDEEEAHTEGRPPRRYYEPTDVGRARLSEAKVLMASRQAALFGDLNPDEAKG